MEYKTIKAKHCRLRSKNSAARTGFSARKIAANSQQIRRGCEDAYAIDQSSILKVSHLAHANLL